MKSEGRLVELPAGYAAVLAELKDQKCKDKGGAGGKPRASSLVLENWKADSGPAAGGGMGLQGY